MLLANKSILIIASVVVLGIFFKVTIEKFKLYKVNALIVYYIHMLKYTK